ncbi:glycine/betaine ABC transporter permease [Pandoraea terrae]|uniref:Glycine/betaine ABC transporter permease n=1 Tax=Pandoraea terrae TaxID=1537710 RepID=A0A5E4W5F8_9BURK|nr:proline/glycine betaine ABC transporter permease [Pandoraea terrae]VVE20177.1 glycine/betaine ABC transporter permease [Pandoraea terrae]
MATVFPAQSAMSIEAPVNRAVEWLNVHYGDTLHAFSAWLLQTCLVPLESGLRALPWWLVLSLVMLIAWHATRHLGRAALLVGGMALIGAMGLWDKLMQTLALVVVATAIAVLIGIPVGIWSARSNLLRNVLTPVLDVMQTMPAFVYLIPALMFFGLGKVPAILATVIYAMPPLVRLTDVGIRQVDAEVCEAAWSFGTTRWQLLVGVQLPLARPSIMAGLNQTVMMALGLVVLASMIGARGLGEEVLDGIQTLNIGKGLQGGIGIVILAIAIDRVMQGYGVDQRTRNKRIQATKAIAEVSAGGHRDGR